MHQHYTNPCSREKDVVSSTRPFSPYLADGGGLLPMISAGHWVQVLVRITGPSGELVTL
jgi:hypothetical protein